MKKGEKSVVWWPKGRPARWAIELTWDVIDGRPEPAEIRIRPVRKSDYSSDDPRTPPEPVPVTTGLLREIPLSQLVASERRRKAYSITSAVYDSDEFSAAVAASNRDHPASKALREARRSGKPVKPGIYKGRPLSDYLPAHPSPEIKALVRAWEREGPGRKPMYGPEHYAAVAAVYLAAWERGKPPTKAVMERGPEAPVSKSTAAKWVARARELGFLAQTTRGKAGGVPEPKTAKPERSKPKRKTKAKPKARPTKRTTKGGRKPSTRGRTKR